MGTRPVRAAIYLRISQDREMDGLAIDRQRGDCIAEAERRNWHIDLDRLLYVDQSISATDRSVSRPDYDRLVADFSAGRWDALVCWDLDRLTRQPRQLEDWIDLAEDRGLRIVTANGEADLGTDAGRLFARVKAAVARSEVERKSARQSAAQAQRAAQGRAPKGVRPLGYTVQGDVIEHEAETVKVIYSKFAAGASLRGIAAALSGRTGTDLPNVPPLPRHSRTLMQERNAIRAQRGLKPRPVPDDEPWSPSTVLGILRNPRYAGYSTYTPKTVLKNGDRRRSWRAAILRDESGDPVRGQWEQLVDEGTWWAVQERLDDPQRRTNRAGTDRKHLGSGLYLCGWVDLATGDECGRPVRAHSQRYRCAGHIMRSMAQIDAYVIETVRVRLARPDLRNLLPSRDEPRMGVIAAEIEQHRGRIARAQADYDGEIIEGRDLTRIRDKAEAAITALEAERVRLASGTNASEVFAAKDPVTAFDAADLATKRSVIDALCEVRLHPHPRGRKPFDPATVTITPA
ncbi:recombinase family protein [Gordonia sp. 852002-51296_SCH5728562-b]|uniref:recombinase family protein n=1 Tax=Gordonia sp. 852002-51296_SCH5728562-b TaxID=1834101 RepID=UPI0007EA410A|nr:recombinase family protein [Gordonia sp. 852002-51296_SCH5728562-b]OBA42039.1 hypothetical protein A5766_19885 [Gordonia sp. 852002-51296_SCH5728562-b]